MSVGICVTEKCWRGVNCESTLMCLYVRRDAAAAHTVVRLSLDTKKTKSLDIETATITFSKGGTAKHMDKC